MDVGGQLVQITTEFILVVRRFEFCEANLQIEIVLLGRPSQVLPGHTQQQTLQAQAVAGVQQLVGLRQPRKDAFKAEGRLAPIALDVPDPASVTPGLIGARRTFPALAPPQPSLPPLRATDSPPLSAVVMPTMDVALGRGPSLAELGIGAAPLPPIEPKVRVQPRYPRRAQSRGTEGFVVVGFRVEMDGRTSNVRVIV